MEEQQLRARFLSAEPHLEAARARVRELGRALESLSAQTQPNATNESAGIQRERAALEREQRRWQSGLKELSGFGVDLKQRRGVPDGNARRAIPFDGTGADEPQRFPRPNQDTA